MATVAEKVLRIVRQIDWWQRQPGKIGLYTELARDLGATGLELAELMFELEDEFLIEISEADRLGWVTVRDVVQYVAGRDDIVP